MRYFIGDDFDAFHCGFRAFLEAHTAEMFFIPVVSKNAQQLQAGDGRSVKYYTRGKTIIEETGYHQRDKEEVRRWHILSNYHY